MTRLAFLTLEDRTGYVIDDGPAITELERRQVQVDEVPWSRPAIPWRSYDAVIIRTTWDYTHDLDRFLLLLGEIERLGVPLANPASLVRWNARKTYLRDLSDRGVPIIPTRFGRAMSAADLRRLPELLGARGGVIKPIVGANASDAYRLSADLSEKEVARIAARFHDREWMAQPFVTGVLFEGEYSLFYFGGILSHAILKRPRAGDFRVQEEHGGRIEAITPDAALRAAGGAVLAALGEAPLQARVDLVRLDDGSLALMELEAIEPSLYFRTHEDAPLNFADAVERWLALRR